MIVTLCGLVLLSACKKSNEESNDEVISYTSSSLTSTLISTFTLQANDSALHSLDSVFFTIDQDRALIYNADSLPVGTNITRMIIKPVTSSSYSTVKVSITGAQTMPDTTYTVTGTTKDSVDFTGIVTLKVTSGDGEHTRDYTVKLNVHKTKPDSLYWDAMARRTLPNTTEQVQDVKAVKMNQSYYILTLDGGTYHIAKAESMRQSSWENISPQFGFTPRIESFTATTEALYILDTDGNLYTSTDGNQWNATSTNWTTIIAGYNNRLLGITRQGETYVHTQYPLPTGYTPKAVSADFPIAGASQAVYTQNNWTTDQQLMIMGGITSKGQLTNTVWGYDGSRWVVLSADVNALPAMRDATLIPYYTYSTETNYWRVLTKTAWLVVGGRKADGTLNRDLYVSTDQGISWTKGFTGMQLPTYIPSFYAAQAFTEMQSKAALAKRRITTPTELTTWDCPYIYLVGGKGSNGQAAYNSIWMGVLQRLSMKPVR